MSKIISSIKLSDTLSLTLDNHGYWLYDYTRNMNLSMGAKTEQQAFVEALTYYQKRLAEKEKELTKLKTIVSGFIDNFVMDVQYGSSEAPDTVLEIQI